MGCCRLIGQGAASTPASQTQAQRQGQQKVSRPANTFISESTIAKRRAGFRVKTCALAPLPLRSRPVAWRLWISYLRSRLTSAGLKELCESYIRKMASDLLAQTTAPIQRLRFTKGERTQRRWSRKKLYFFASFALRIRSSVVSDSKRQTATAGAQ
ncbi:hypothetical protein COLO4_02587 [Corchorus olitorius]|uniref:Uncharacterized protein n=1 Tax=Corchorus olitorius TaxID=93759 RepID=A0A1R3L0Q9_9ROSI|nr:hypothetical protein COLO4_02587 [Corchorus olitorius]